MKNKKGFTLVELLAVIVVLGVIMAIAGTAVLGQRRKANIEVAKKLEKTITDLGPNIYSYEKSTNNDNSDFMKAYKKVYEVGYEEYKFKISVEKLGVAGYLKDLSSENKIKNPAGGDDCVGYLVVVPNGEEMFMGYIDCPNLYTTDFTDIGIDINNDVAEFDGSLKPAE